ncbi:hypothetical protein C0989_005257 [Termitomyces sp. Mn162]|nr:hypothetical protein C0989_005257 [Termitomyces sp. Mn162]
MGTVVTMEGQVLRPRSKTEFDGALKSAPQGMLEFATSHHNGSRDSAVMLERLPTVTPVQPPVGGWQGVTMEGSQGPATQLYPTAEPGGTVVSAEKGETHVRVMLFWKNHVEVPKTSTQQHLAARVAKHIVIQRLLGDNMIPTDPVKYMDIYMLFLAQEVVDCLHKELWGLQALSAMPSPYLGGAYVPQLSPVNKALTLLQALQQPGKMPYDYMTKQAAVDYQQ